MNYAAKQNKSDNQIAEANLVEDQSNSIAKDRISEILRSNDYESAAHSAADEAISGNANNNNPLSSKQLINQKSHIRDILTSPSAINISKQTLENIENKYSADFSSVNFYQDEQSTRSVNAKAYTYGTDIVLSPRYYQPNTVMGNKLLAHELAHVIQQDRSGRLQLQRDEAQADRVSAKQLLDYNDSLKEILPRTQVDEDGIKKDFGTGLHSQILISGVLLDTFKDDRIIGALTRAIAADKDAKSVARTYGLRGIIALYDANIDAGKAVELIKTQKRFYSTDAIVERSKQTQTIRESLKSNLTKINSETRMGAEADSVYKNVDRHEIKASWALSLSADNLSNLKQMLPLLSRTHMLSNGIESRYLHGEKSLKEGYAKLKKCYLHYTSSEGSREYNPKPYRLAKEALSKIKKAKDNLAFLPLTGNYDVDSVFDGVYKSTTKLSKIVSNWKAYRKTQRGVYHKHRKLYKFDINEISQINDDLRKHKDVLSDNKKLLADRGKSATRISLLIRYFVALNDKSYSGAPTLLELAEHTDDFHEIAKDVAKIIGSTNEHDVFLYEQLAGLIKNQILSRKGIKDKQGIEPNVKPTREDIEKYFLSLRQSPNEDVIAAYQHYSGGFFQHRDKPPIGRLGSPTTDEIYGYPETISGSRMLVCTGFAQLGKHLFMHAGADFQKFLVWAEFTRDEILSGNVDSAPGHMVTKLKRKNKNIYVSNQETYTSALSAFQSVGYASGSGKTIVKGEGKTAKGASDDFVKEFMKEVKKIK